MCNSKQNIGKARDDGRLKGIIDRLPTDELPELVDHFIKKIFKDGKQSGALRSDGEPNSAIYQAIDDDAER